MVKAVVAIGTAVLSAAFLTGCTSSSAPPESLVTASAVPTVAAPAVSEDEDFEPYFTAVASGDPVALSKAATDLAAPSSNAYAYAVIQGALQQSDLDSGRPGEKQTVSEIDEGFRICPQVVSEESPCSDFTNLVGQDGRLADFNAGELPLAGRLSLGNETEFDLGGLGTVRLIGAYKSIAGSVIVVIEARSATEGLSLAYTASYQAPNGRQSDSAYMSGPIELANGSLANYTYMFPGAEFGGTLSLSAYNAGYDEASLQIPIL